MQAQLQFSNSRIDCRQSRYPAGTVRQRHYHDTSWVVFTFSGSFALTMRSAESHLTSRSLLYVPAGETHSNVFGSQGAGVFVIAIDPAWIGDRLENASTEADKPRIAPAGLLIGPALKIYREFRSPDTLSDLIVEGAFLELLGCWFRHDFHKDRGAPSWLRQVKGLLHDTFRQSVSLDQVAQAAVVHPSHVAREFRPRLWPDRWRLRPQAACGICGRALGAPPNRHFFVDGSGLDRWLQQPRPHGVDVQARPWNDSHRIPQGSAGLHQSVDRTSIPWKAHGTDGGLRS